MTTPSLFPFRLLWLGRPWRWGLWARGLFDIGPVRLDWRQ